jgi:ABC-2 type transport system permease protein
LGVSAFIALSLGFYASFRDEATQLNDVLNKLPATARALFSDTGNFLTPEGFLSARLYYLMLPLLLSVLAISLGASMIAREEESGTIELLISRPISRAKLLFAKALSSLIILLVVSGVALGVTIVICHLVKLSIPTYRLVLATMASTVLALLFGALAFAITTIGRARSAAVGISVLVALGGYIVASLEGTVKWLHWPSTFLPYHYYHPSQTLHGYFSWYDFCGLLAVSAIIILIAQKSFAERDING